MIGNYAEICLEAWGHWMLDNHGFPSRSAIARIGESNDGAFKSSMPIGVSPRERTVDHANRVFGAMNASCEQSVERANLLKLVIRQRQGGETIKALLERLNLAKRRHQYHKAMEEFSIRLEVIVYLHQQRKERRVA